MKLKSKKSAKPFLSDRIAEALTVQPRADIEDDHVFSTKPKTVSRADLASSDSEDETVISEFRKRNVNLLSTLSNKYEGEVISRKQLKGEYDGSVTSDIGADEKEIETGKSLSARDSDDGNSSTDDIHNKLKAALQASSDSDDLDSDDGESDDYSISQNKLSDEEEEDKEGYDISQMDEPPKEEFEHMKKQNVSEEAKKGASVRNQLLVWESFLEMRIHLQRCMNTANQMPMPDVYEDLAQIKDFAEKCNVSKANLTNVLDKFLLLQNLLFKKFPETKNLVSNKVQDTQKSEVTQKPNTESDEEIPSDTDNEEIPSDTEPEDNADDPTTQTSQKEKPTQQTKKRKLVDYEKEISTSHKAFKSFRDSTIQKWNEKTRLATANLKNAPTNTILQQISYILSDKDKLVRRTQLKRSEYDIIGYKNEPSTSNNKSVNDSEQNLVTKDRKDDDEYIPEIFDDSDFYHQLLRELIECKSADVTDPVQLSRQWIALQQMRSKMKRKVDTKATKGRKIKYVVHNKLVNYMAPEKCNTWSDESATELFNSLFGKLFEQNNIGVTVNLENGFKLKN